MRNKSLYIIESLIVLLFLITTKLCIIEIAQDDIKISALTAESAALRQDISTLQSAVSEQAQTITELTEENERLKALQTKQPEAKKTNESDKSDRSGERPRYNLTDSERDLVEKVVMAESGGECFEGQILVAQCILNAAEIDGIRPAQAIKKYAYAKGRPNPSGSVKRAVSAVFDRGETVTDEPIVYFYAPKVVRSEFHEAQRFAVELGGHRFFCKG